MIASAPPPTPCTYFQELSKVQEFEVLVGKEVKVKIEGGFFYKRVHNANDSERKVLMLKALEKRDQCTEQSGENVQCSSSAVFFAFPCDWLGCLTRASGDGDRKKKSFRCVAARGCFRINTIESHLSLS
jgi:hypothetical protein